MLAMVIDDSRAMRSILRRLLVPTGCEVIEADNGRTALQSLNTMETMPDVALVDWNMPEVNGLEFIGAVRAQPHMRDITLMMVTTESDPQQIVRAMAAGAHEYIIKPFTADVITDKLSYLGLLNSTAP